MSISILDRERAEGVIITTILDRFRPDLREVIEDELKGDFAAKSATVLSIGNLLELDSSCLSIDMIALIDGEKMNFTIENCFVSQR